MEDTLESNSYLLRGLSPVIFSGRLFGALSLRVNVLLAEKTRENKRKINPAYFLSILVTAFLFISSTLVTRRTILKFHRDKHTFVKLEGFNHATYSASMFIIYLYQLFTSGKLETVIHNFLQANRTSQLQSFTERQGFLKYPRFSILIITICLSLGISENLVFDRQILLRGVAGNTTFSLLQLYHNQYFKPWHIIFSEYSAPVTLTLLIFTKLATLGWIHIDIICVTLCRALWEKLWIISEKLRWNPFDNNQQPGSNQIARIVMGKPTQTCDLKDTDIYLEEYVMVTDLIEQVQKYISPLILTCYVANMYVLIVMMFNWIGPFYTEAMSVDKTVHVAFAFFQFFWRVTILTYFAGEIHQMCLQIRRQILMCPSYMYSLSMERFENILVANPAGICLFGSFMITRKFFVSIVSFIFTSEIVLLQSYSGYHQRTQIVNCTV